MLAHRFLQEGPNADLSWLFYALLGFMALTIVVGAWVGREKRILDSKSGNEARASSSEPKSASRKRKPLVRKKSR